MKETDERTGTDIMARLSAAGNIVPPELGDALKDAVESALDSLLVDEFLSSLPGVKILVGLMKFGVGVDNLLFIRKSERFLFEFNNPEEERERQQFFSKLREDEKLRQRVEENLVLMLHRLDDMQKPTLLARVFRAHYVTERIDHQTFQKLRTAVERIKPHNIQDLLDYYENPSGSDLPSNENLQDLAYCGLVSFVSGMWFKASDDSSRNFTRNKFGTLFVEIALEQDANAG